MLAVAWGERALPVAWRVEETEGSIGFPTQEACGFHAIVGSDFTGRWARISREDGQRFHAIVGTPLTG
jgi:hypothetical protein